MEVGANVNGRNVAAVAGRRREVGSRKLNFRWSTVQNCCEAPTKRLAARNRAIGAVIAAAIGIFLVLQACVGSWSLATVLFLTLPGGRRRRCDGGAGLRAAACRSASLLGLVAVLGIAVRNGLALIKHYQRLAMMPDGEALTATVGPSTFARSSDARIEPARTADDAAIFAPGVVQRGTWDRFTPILMTALVTAVAVLPLAFIGDVPGSEILRPMAIVILGGLVTSTLFALFCVPAMYLLFTPQPCEPRPGRPGGIGLVGEQERARDDCNHRRCRVEPAITVQTSTSN